MIQSWTGGGSGSHCEQFLLLLCRSCQQRRKALKSPVTGTAMVQSAECLNGGSLLDVHPWDQQLMGQGLLRELCGGETPQYVRKLCVHVGGPERESETNPMLSTMWWRVLCWPAWVSSWRAASLPQAAGHSGSVSIKFHTALIKMFRWLSPFILHNVKLALCCDSLEV